jgi:hypothetical protein
MRVFNNLLMKSSTIVLAEEDNFPSSPSIGQFCFKNGILYIYATLNEISTWYPLTNRSLYYVHTQGVSAITWTVNHNLATNDLIIMVYDDEDTVQLGAGITFTTINSFTIDFTELTKGRAVIFAAADEYSLSGANTTLGVVGFCADDTERDAITALSDGMMIVTTSDGSLNVYKGATSSWLKISGSGGGGTYSTASSNTLAASGDAIFANTSGGSFTLTLPSTPTMGDFVEVIDGTGSFQTYPLTIARNGQKIMSTDEDMVADVANSYTKLVFFNATYGWRVL